MLQNLTQMHTTTETQNHDYIMLFRTTPNRGDKMKEIKITVSELASICHISYQAMMQYCTNYQLSKWLAEKERPRVFRLNNESISAFQAFLNKLDHKNTKYNNRLERFNTGINKIVKTMQDIDQIFEKGTGEWEDLLRFMDENEFSCGDFLACICSSLLKHPSQFFNTRLMIQGVEFTINIKKSWSK